LLAFPEIVSLNFNRHFLRSEDPATRAITNSTRKTKNKILAMDAAPAAIPVNPNNAAISAIIKKVNDQRNIALRF
jgi:hypothetical protein